MPAKNGDTVCLTDRSVRFAGKPGSNRCMQGLCWRHPVGASGRHSDLPAKNNDAVYLKDRGA